MTKYLRATRRVLALLAALCCAALAPAQDTPPADQPLAPLPSELEGVGIVEKLNAPLPLDTTFVDHTGRPVKLREYFDGKHPVILTLNFYKCPMLCGLQFQGLIEALKPLEMTAGNEFRIVTLSFDPLENEVLANAKRRTMLAAYGRQSSGAGWAFLTSPNRSKEIQTVLDATGFSVKFVGGSAGWAHKAALIICTPDGRISRYLPNVQYDPKTLRGSLVEASAGKIGTLADQFFLYCFHYDGARGKYAMRAMSVMQVGGAVVLLVVSTFVFSLWRRERRSRSGLAVQ